MATRLQDIADELGISKVTVSKVLRGSPDVGPAMRERVQNRMRELDYQPNYQARALAGGKTYSIGLIVPDLVHPFFAEVAKGVGSVVRGSGRVLLIGSSEEDPGIERQQISALSQRGVDALLLASCQPHLQARKTPGNQGPPVILLDRDFERSNLPYVGSNHYRVGEIAMQHLVQTGCKRIAHIGSDATSTGRQRLRAFRDVMAANHLRVPKDYVVTRERFEESGERAGYEAMRELLRCKRPPDAVFCYNDVTAIGAIEAAANTGLRIPDEIAFVGCGNFRYGNYLRVPLSSIDQAAQSIGVAAGRLALDVIEKTTAHKRRIVLLEPSLVVRSSSLSARP